MHELAHDSPVYFSESDVFLLVQTDAWRYVIQGCPRPTEFGTGEGISFGQDIRDITAECHPQGRRTNTLPRPHVTVILSNGYTQFSQFFCRRLLYSVHYLRGITFYDFPLPDAFLELVLWNKLEIFYFRISVYFHSIEHILKYIISEHEVYFFWRIQYLLTCTIHDVMYALRCDCAVISASNFLSSISMSGKSNNWKYP